MAGAVEQHWAHIAPVLLTGFGTVTRAYCNYFNTEACKCTSACCHHPCLPSNISSKAYKAAVQLAVLQQCQANFACDRLKARNTTIERIIKGQLVVGQGAGMWHFQHKCKLCDYLQGKQWHSAEGQAAFHWATLKQPCCSHSPASGVDSPCHWAQLAAGMGWSAHHFGQSVLGHNACNCPNHNSYSVTGTPIVWFEMPLPQPTTSMSQLLPFLLLLRHQEVRQL